MNNRRKIGCKKLLYEEYKLLSLETLSDATNVHVLNDQIRGAVIHKATAEILILEQWAQLCNELLLSVFLENHVLILFNDDETLIENICAILLAHESLELWEFA